MPNRIAIMSQRLAAQGGELFRRAAVAGLDLEWTALVDYAADPLFEPGSRKRQIELARAHGVGICSGSLQFLKKQPLHELDKEKRAAALRLFSEWTAIYAEAGAKVLLAAIVDEKAFSGGAEYPQLVDGFRRASERAAREGMLVCIETYADDRALIRLLDDVGSPDLKVYVDTANVLHYGWDPALHIRALGARVGQVHLKDYTKEAGLAGVNLGQGVVDFHACARALREVGFEGRLVLETQAGDDPLAAAKANVEFAKRVFGGLVA